MLDLWYQVQKGDCYEAPHENSKHQLEAKKYLITDESMEKTEVQVILIEGFVQ